MCVCAGAQACSRVGNRQAQCVFRRKVARSERGAGGERKEGEGGREKGGEREGAGEERGTDGGREGGRESGMGERRQASTCNEDARRSTRHQGHLTTDAHTRIHTHTMLLGSRPRGRAGRSIRQHRLLLTSPSSRTRRASSHPPNHSISPPIQFHRSLGLFRGARHVVTIALALC